MGDAEAERFFEGHPDALAVFRTTRSLIASLGPTAIRTTKSQVAFVRRTAFAWLWMPGRWLKNPTAEVVLSIALGREDASPRFKQVAHPAPAVWMHHLELHRAEDLDDQVLGWLREAYERAG